MPDGADRRRHVRVRLDGRLAGRATVLTDFRVVALSPEGATLELSVPLAVGSPIDLTLNLSHSSVDVKGRIVHHEPAGGGAPARHLVGVEFEAIDTLDRGLLESFLEQEGPRAP
jgi:hypothetical protein